MDSLLLCEMYILLYCEALKLQSDPEKKGNIETLIKFLKNFKIFSKF